MGMTFSREVKEELSKIIPKARHCRIAEYAVLFWHFGEIITENGCRRLIISCEQEMIARKCFTLTEKTFNIICGLQKNSRGFLLEITEEDAITDILSAVKMTDTGPLRFHRGEHVNNVLLKTECCRRAYLRSAYLCCGSISDPGKGYHLEFVLKNAEEAEQISEILKSFEINAKTVLRKKYHVVYIKEGQAIVELLNVLGAHVSMMNLENFRILHEIAGETNRRVNCETANLLKSVNAANSQIDDIEFIAETMGLSVLSPSLREMAEVRLQHPDASLKELGEFLDPPVGKSGVNHRLRKIQEFAEKHRGKI